MKSCCNINRTTQVNFNKILVTSKIPIITLLAMAGIAMITVGLLAHYQIIHPLSNASKWSLVGVGGVFEIALAGFIYRHLHRSAVVFATLENMRQAIQNEEASHILEHFLENTERVVTHDSHWIGSEKTWFGYMNECACLTQKFDRLKNLRRQSLENEMLTYAKAHCQVDQPLRYLSIGAGGLLQDFINVSKLLQAGFKKLEIVLVSPGTNDRIAFLKRVQADGDNAVEEELENLLGRHEQFEFLYAVAREKKCDLKISYLSAVNEVTGKFHIVQAIDFDDFKKEEAFQAIVTAQSVVSGRLYLAFDNHDYLFDATTCLEHKTHRQGVIQTHPINQPALTLLRQIKG